MCVQYWPASKEKHETYGGISLSIVQEEELANFHIRTFKLCKMELGVSSSNNTNITSHYNKSQYVYSIP